MLLTRVMVSQRANLFVTIIIIIVIIIIIKISGHTLISNPPDSNKPIRKFMFKECLEIRTKADSFWILNFSF